MIGLIVNTHYCAKTDGIECRAYVWLLPFMIHACLFTWMHEELVGQWGSWTCMTCKVRTKSRYFERSLGWCFFHRVEIFASLVHWFISEASRFASIHCGHPTPSGPSEVVPTKEAVPTVEHATRKPMSASVALENGKETQSSEHLDVWYAQDGAVWWGEMVRKHRKIYLFYFGVAWNFA